MSRLCCRLPRTRVVVVSGWSARSIPRMTTTAAATAATTLTTRSFKTRTSSSLLRQWSQQGLLVQDQEEDVSAIIARCRMPSDSTWAMNNHYVSSSLHKLGSGSQRLLYHTCNEFQGKQGITRMVQKRPMSTSMSSWIQQKLLLRLPSPSSPQSSGGGDSGGGVNQDDIQHVLDMVTKYDHVSTIPGMILPTPTTRLSYFTIRCFWIETGIRKKPVSSSYNKSSSSSSSSGSSSSPEQEEYLNWWKASIADIYDDTLTSSSSSSSLLSQAKQSSTIRLLRYLIHDQNVPFSQRHFNTILQGRVLDLDNKQYETLDDLIYHVGTVSCTPIYQLLFESSSISKSKLQSVGTASGTTTNSRTTGTGDAAGLGGDANGDAAGLVGGGSGDDTDQLLQDMIYNFGIGHGVTNALRLSIPIMSTTGKLILPKDLCLKHNIKSPRYLLSALGQGDVECKQNMSYAVEELVTTARQHIQHGKDRQLELTRHDAKLSTLSKQIFLSIVASETFLNRLQSVDYDLTNRGLRNVSYLEHLQCTLRMLRAL